MVGSKPNWVKLYRGPVALFQKCTSHAGLMLEGTFRVKEDSFQQWNWEERPFMHLHVRVCFRFHTLTSIVWFCGHLGPFKLSVFPSVNPHLNQTSSPVTFYPTPNVLSVSLTHSSTISPCHSPSSPLLTLIEHVTAKMSHLGKKGFSMHLTAVLFRHVLERI